MRRVEDELQELQIEPSAELEADFRNVRDLSESKALVEALGATPAAVAARFGVPVFDMLVRWSATKEPFLREAIEKNIAGSKLTGRLSSELARVRAALGETAPVRRDPTTYVGPTRGRGRKAKSR